jgi:Spy/CpxP family protein refolding chaperone
MPTPGGPAAVPNPSSSSPGFPTTGNYAQPSPTPPAEQRATADSGGIVELVDEALSGIDLSSKQQDELQQLGADVNAHMSDVEKGKKDLVLDLAKEIEAGHVDESTLKPDEEKVEKAAESASPDLRAAFQKMHDLLSADQRKQFVSGFREALSKRASKLDAKTQVDEWAKTLSLNDDQKQKITAILDEEKSANDDARARLDKVLDAFPSDSFTIDQVLPEGSPKDRADRMMHRIVDQARKVTDVLTPEQRATAAKTIRDKVSEKAGSPEGSMGHTTQGLTARGEATTTQSEPWWAGRAGFYGRGFGGWGVGRAYGFGRGFGTGFGGAWLF